MNNKKAVKIGIISGIALLIGVVAIVPSVTHKKDTSTVMSKSSQIVKSSSNKSSKDLRASTSGQSTAESNHSEGEVNPDGKTSTERKAPTESSTESKSVSEKDIETAGQTGEHSDKVFDVKVKDGATISEQDIANARKTLNDAGINDGVYSDLDIAKVIKAASDKSLDIVTVAKDGKF